MAKFTFFLILATFCLWGCAARQSAAPPPEAPASPGDPPEAPEVSINESQIVSLILRADPPAGWVQTHGDVPENALAFSLPSLDAQVLVVFLQVGERTPYLAVAEMMTRFSADGSRIIDMKMSTDGNEASFRFIKPTDGMPVKGKLVARKLGFPPNFIVMCLGLWPAEFDAMMLPHFDSITRSARIEISE